jgi:hypothetical protein
VTWTWRRLRRVLASVTASLLGFYHNFGVWWDARHKGSVFCPNALHLAVLAFGHGHIPWSGWALHMCGHGLLWAFI